MRLDVVIPAHNEQHRIGRTLGAYVRVCTDPEYRFIIALDRCTDATADVVREHMAEDPRVHMLEFGKLGKGGVLIEAFRACDADFVGFVDADCATPPREFLRLVAAAQTADAAIATRHHPAAVLPKARPLQRRIASAGFSLVAKALFGLGHSDTQCGAKVVRGDVLRSALPMISSRDFLFDVDLLFITKRLGYHVAEVPTIWIERDGSRMRANRDALLMAASALRLWLHHKVIPVPAVSDVEPIVTSGNIALPAHRDDDPSPPPDVLASVLRADR